MLGIDKIRVGIQKQKEGLKMQDEGLAAVQAAVKDNPLRVLGPLLDALMAGNKTSPPSGDGHVAKCKATVPNHQPPTTVPSTALSTTPSTSITKTSTISEKELPHLRRRSQIVSYEDQFAIRWEEI